VFHKSKYFHHMMNCMNPTQKNLFTKQKYFCTKNIFDNKKNVYKNFRFGRNCWVRICRYYSKISLIYSNELIVSFNLSNNLFPDTSSISVFSNLCFFKLPINSLSFINFLINPTIFRSPNVLIKFSLLTS